MSSNKNTSARASSANMKPNKQNKNKNKFQNAALVTKAPRVMGAATFAPLSTRSGLPDFSTVQIEYLAGFVYVGNGTLGATDSVYFMDATSTFTLPGHIPILSADSIVGQTYVADIEKHFARKVYKTIELHLISLQPATSNNMMVVIAPIRGQGSSDITTAITNTGASLTLGNVVGMSDVKSAASYESIQLNMSPYIAGGSGSRQNEFDIQNNNANANFISNNGLTGIVPCCFALSGQNLTAALRGSKTHMVVIRQVVDWVDFIGGVSLNAPIGLRLEKSVFGRKTPTPVPAPF